MRPDRDFKPRFDIMARWIEAKSKVLSIGCGNGVFETYLVSVKLCEITGIDISQNALRLAAAAGLQVIEADVRQGLPLIEGDFDYVLCSEVLEHIPVPEDLLTEIKQKKLFSRNLICSIPNIAHFWHRLRLLRGRFPVQCAFEPSEHLRFWSIPDFVELVRRFGYEVVKMEASNGFPSYYGTSKWLPLYKIWPNLFGNQICFKLAQRRETSAT